MPARSMCMYSPHSKQFTQKTIDLLPPSDQQMSLANQRLHTNIDRPVSCPSTVEVQGSWDSLSAKLWPRDQKIASLNPGRSGSRISFSRVNFVCWLLLSVCSTTVLLQWHVKDPSHSAKSAGGRLHQNMHTPLTQ